jgi:hypothetical protein
MSQARKTVGDTKGTKGNYEIGYGRPPKHGQFKPGKSGNPKGRPVGSANVSTIVKRVVHKKVSVRQGEKSRQIPMLEAMLHTHAAKGVKGDPRSAGLVINLLPKAGLLSEQEGGIDQQLLSDIVQKSRRRPSTELFEHVDLTLLSDEDKIELSRLGEIVDIGGGMTALSVTDFTRARELVNKGRGKDVTPTKNANSKD